MDTKELPSISVVVIGRNEGSRLSRCLESIRRSDWPAERLELVYVDTASTDNSCRTASDFGARVIETHPERPSAAAARNEGMRAARGDLVHFFDGDTIVDPGWFRKAASLIAPANVVCVFGQRREVDPRRNVYHFWADQDWIFRPGVMEFCGGDALFRRAALVSVGGYDPTLIAGEERDLAHRLLRSPGVTILGVADAMTLHDIGITRFRQYWRRCMRSGWAYAEVSSRYRDLLSWRRVVRRNLFHLGLLAAVLAAVVLFRSPWPLVVWAGSITVAVARDAARCRAQAGSMSGALLYACHHYLSKVPAVIGHLQYFASRLGKTGPRGLIEYRDPSEAPDGHPPT